MNFVTAFQQGQKGKNIGLPLGIPSLDKNMGGVHRKSLYGVAAGPKCGKTTFADFSFLLQPYLYQLKHPEVEIDFIYFSMEVDIIEKQFKIASFFFYHEYNLSHFTYLGKEYEINSDYLLGKVKDHLGNMIPVSEEHSTILKAIFKKHIKVLFGIYDNDGRQVQEGKVHFIPGRKTPSEIKKFLLYYAQKNGKFIFDDEQNAIGYTATNPEKYTIIITDHLRKLKIEKGETIKSNIDNLLHVHVEFRNTCYFTFVDIIHLNRSISSVERIKHFSDKLYPNGDDLKETGETKTNFCLLCHHILEKIEMPI